MLIHQSMLSAWTRCPQQMFLERNGNRGIQTSALSFGTVMHYAIEVFEREWRTGTKWNAARIMASDTFRHYWHPIHIEAVCPPVELWLPRQTYPGLARIGVEAIDWYAGWAKTEDEELLATEFGFQVPIEGTWDYDLDEPHILAGTLDRLSAKYFKAKPVLCVGDLKGLAVETPLPTPSGWTTMGAIEVGDRIFGSDGRPYPVIAKSNVQWKPCYRLTFDDTTSIIADRDHLWMTTEGPVSDRREIRTTEWLAENFSAGRSRDKRIFNAAPLELPHAELPVHPYVLGVWLGDGKHSSGEISKPDADLWRNIIACGYKTGISPGITKSVLGLRTQLRTSGLLGHKHIPDEYLRASLDQRLALLQGLMDSDGSWNRARYQAVFTNTNKALAQGVLELVNSLGWRGLVSAIQRSGFGVTVTSYDVTFSPFDYNPFRLARKRDLVTRLDPSPGARTRRRMIVNVERIDTVPTQCISVASPDATYLCGEQMVPTHNTGKDYTYLRQHLQFGAYTLATTRPEFWLGWRGEDGFGERGPELYERFKGVARRGEWISLKSKKVMDAGWRGPDDYTRFALAVEQLVASIKADIYPLSLSGEHCSYCPQRSICAGVGVPTDQHGAPA